MPDRWDEATREDIRQALLVYLRTYDETRDSRPIADWILALTRRAYAEGLERAAVVANSAGCDFFEDHTLHGHGDNCGCTIAAAIRAEKPSG